MYCYQLIQVKDHKVQTEEFYKIGVRFICDVNFFKQSKEVPELE